MTDVLLISLILISILLLIAFYVVTVKTAVPDVSTTSFVSDLDPEAMRGLWWPNDDSWMPYFDGGVECYRRGEKNPPWPGADTYADVMANQGWLYAKALDRTGC